jgi:para-nitrobenzyl esterase
MRALLFTSACAAACLLAGASSAQTLVNTTSGPVQGVDLGDVLAWRGVPYAEAPVGPLRYARPVREPTSISTVDATVNGPVCPQIPSLAGCGPTGTFVGNEDCLSLYVWRPENPTTTPMPVMVFIHGGGGVQGCASSPTTNGADLALSQDVVVVSIQYRLGALGFFGLPALAGADPNGSTGNYAHLDQLEALDWVRDNIAAFGGDPNNVTIFGESAGAVAVCVLLASPLSDGLFDRAIIESGGCQLALPLETTPGSPYDGATIFERSESVATLAGCPAGPGQLDCLRSLSAQTLVDALDSLPSSFAGLAPANTALDGYVLTEQPVWLLRQGAADGRPVIVGSNKDESTLFTIGLESTMNSTPIYEQTVRTQLGDTTADLVLPLYPVVPPTTPADTYRELVEDAGWSCPTLGVADALAEGGSPAYVYHLTFPPDYNEFVGLDFLQTFHGLDLFYLFGTYANLASLGIMVGAADAALSDAMQAAWGSFARTGAPATTPAWPAYAPTTPGDLASVSVLHFDVAHSLVAGDLFRAGNCAELAPIGQLLDPDHDNAIYDVDNCGTVTNTSQADGDMDGVGQACDTCIDVPNPPFTGTTTNRTLVSGQLDDDADGRGNHCDMDFNQAAVNVGGPDTALMVAALTPVSSVNDNDCGPSGTSACGIHDLNGAATNIGGPDTAVLVSLLAAGTVGLNAAPNRHCGALPAQTCAQNPNQACCPPFSRALGSAEGATIGKVVCQNATGVGAPQRCPYAN